MKNKLKSLMILILFSSLAFAACGDSGGSSPAGTPKDWQTAELIETDNEGDARTPQIAMDPDGNAMVLWAQSDGTADNILVNRYVEGSGWAGAELIESNDGYASNPQLAVDSDGDAIAVWMQDDGFYNSIYSNIFTKSTESWGGAGLIESKNGHASGPQIAVNPQGNAAVVWIQNESGEFNVYADRCIKGSGWAGAELIDSGAGQASDPQTIIDSEDNVIVVWAQTDGAADTIFANRYINGSGWEGVQPIEDNSGNAISPQIAADSEGNAIAVWSQDNGVRYSIYANRYVKATNSWGSDGLIETDDNGYANSPQIAIDSSGNAIAIWCQDIGNYRAFANRYNKTTGSWADAELIDNNDSKVYSPQIAADSHGNAIAVWEQVGGTADNIWANRYVNGSGWSTAMLIETDAGNAQSPQIAIDANGNAIAVWEQEDGTRYNIWANYFYK